MDVVTPKENILRRIREALGAVPMGTARPVDLETPVYPEIKGDEAVVFAENFTAQGGALVYCEDADAAVRSLQELVSENGWDDQIYCADEEVRPLLEIASVRFAGKPLDAVLKKVGICSCRALVAGEGSVIFDSGSGGRRVLAHAETMVFVATTQQVMPDLHAAMRQVVRNRSGSSLFVWTGLSRFLDIDEGLMPGLGPKAIYLLLIDNC